MKYPLSVSDSEHMLSLYADASNYEAIRRSLRWQDAGNGLTGSSTESQNETFEIVPGLATGKTLDAAIHLNSPFDQQ